MRYLIFLSIFWNILAPLPPGYAINPQTKECGSIGWEDEYGQYLLFPPWEKHYGDLIQNENVSCQVDQYNTVEICCQKVGYTYLPGNIGKQYGIMLMTPVGFIVLLFKVLPFLIIGFILYRLIKWSNKRENQNKVT